MLNPYKFLLFIFNEYNRMKTSNQLEIFDMLATLLVTISSGQHILQCIRQVIASHPLFNPMSLFKYLTKNTHILTKKHILTFMEENNSNISEEQIKIFFQCYGLKDKMQYTDFLNYIYPLNSSILREISQNQIKNYNQTVKLPIHQEIITGFYLLLNEEQQLIKKIQVQKNDTMPRMSKQKFRKVLKSIKKASQKQQIHCENKENTINSLELRNFIKAFIEVGDHQFLHLGRRLNMDQQGLIPLENLQFWLRPWKKNSQKNSQKLTPTKLYKGKQFNEQTYRQSLTNELSKSINKQNLTPRDKMPFHGQIFKGDKLDQISNYQKTFKQFIERFIVTSKEIEKLKDILINQLKVNLMTIFKKIDVQQRGIIRAEDLKRFYINVGGIHHQWDYQFIIQRYSQSQYELSYSQFCQIFSPNHQQPQNRQTYISQQSFRVITQILYMNMQSQVELNRIKNKLYRGQGKILFDQINKQKSGFINYQELKKFAISLGKNLSMQELMLILKRLDKSKNGVVVQGQFLAYFNR